MIRAEQHMDTIHLFTIGFAGKSAETFFSRLRDAGVRRVVDIRLNNVSQLAGFTKKDDLRFFLKQIGNMGYVHRPDLAPTKEILDAYKKLKGDWPAYETQFTRLMVERHIEDVVPRDLMDFACLLCSEDKAEHCHRRLVAEYLQRRWGSVQIRHL